MAGWLARRLGRGGPIIPLVRLQGVIAPDHRPGRLNIAGVGPLLEKAFSIKPAPAVAIIVNSPGGSAVQARLISKRIRDLADKKKKQVLVFVEDAAASGGYFIAVAGDEIIADPSSIVGSIGVIYAGFGFVEAIDKLGVERRLYTAGVNKATLDPFLPAKDGDIERIKALETDVHRIFISHVKARRGGKLKGSEDMLFSGEFWTGERGLELGLVDRLGDFAATIKARFGDKVKVKPIAPKRPLLNLPRFGLGGGAAAEILAQMEERALWSRLGL